MARRSDRRLAPTDRSTRGGSSSPTVSGASSRIAPRGGRVRLSRYGFRRHYRLAPWSTFVEVHWAKGAEAYVTPVSDDEVGVAFLWHERAPSWEAMLSRFPHLARLRGASALSSIQGAGPFRRRPRRVTAGRLALVGDASGYVDAITGEGVAIAFECARDPREFPERGRACRPTRPPIDASCGGIGERAEVVLALAAFPDFDGRRFHPRRTFDALRAPARPRAAQSDVRYPPRIREDSMIARSTRNPLDGRGSRHHRNGCQTDDLKDAAVRPGGRDGEAHAGHGRQNLQLR